MDEDPRQAAYAAYRKWYRENWFAIEKLWRGMVQSTGPDNVQSGEPKHEANERHPENDI